MMEPTPDVLSLLFKLILHKESKRTPYSPISKTEFPPLIRLYLWIMEAPEPRRFVKIVGAVPVEAATLAKVAL